MSYEMRNVGRQQEDGIIGDDPACYICNADLKPEEVVVVPARSLYPCMEGSVFMCGACWEDFNND